MVKNKRGLSGIIVTLLILVLVFVAIGIVWVVIKNMVQSGTGDIELNQKCLNTDVQATAVDCTNPAACDITFKRTGSNTEAIAGVKLVFRDSTAGTNSAVVDKDDFPTLEGDIEVLAGKSVTGIDSTLATPDALEVTPYFEDASGKEQICPQTTTFEF